MLDFLFSVMFCQSEFIEIAKISKIASKSRSLNMIFFRLKNNSLDANTLVQPNEFVRTFFTE